MTYMQVIKSACCIVALTIVVLLNYHIFLVVRDFQIPIVFKAVHQDLSSPAKDTNHHNQDTADGNIVVQGNGSRLLRFVREDYYDREHSPHMQHQPPLDLKVSSELPSKEVPTTKPSKPTSSTETPKTESSTPEHPLRASGASGGFVLAESYWEQQSSGCRNFQFLLCWAGRLNLTVVEPFMEDSVPRTHLSTPSPRHGHALLRLSDLYNTEIWSQYSRRRHHASMAPWEHFLRDAPRNLITVHLKYKQGEQNKKEEPSPLERIKSGCNKVWPSQSQIDFLKTKGFRIVRGVCLNFAYGDHFTMQQFHQSIYGNYSPNETTVVFSEWRGIGSGGRVFISDTPCQASLHQTYLTPSRRLVADAKKYIDKYLTAGSYVAIMARMEKAKQMLRKMHAKSIVPFCFDKLVKYWNATKAASGIKTLFLSIDMGKYGSNSFRDSGDGSNLLTEFTKFGREVYGSTFSVSQWESTFEEIGQTTDAGYIALLQKVIVIRASCVIFLGGGSFQRHALYLYQKLHPQRGEDCVRIVAECIGNRDKNKLTSLIH